MNRRIGLALITFIMITLAAGCTQKTAAPTATVSNTLKDGTYYTTGIADKNNWVPEITLTITAGKITAVKYDETTAMRKSENIDYQKSLKVQKNVDLLSIYSAMQNSLIKSQDITKLDAIAGATKALESFKSLAASALSNAKDSGKYKDGEYSAMGIKDDMNWTPVVYITIKDGKIAAVKYDEVSSRVFKNKSKDKAYLAKYKAKNKLDLTAVYEGLQKSLIDKQAPEKLDAVAGATLAHDNFAAMAAKALEQAR